MRNTHDNEEDGGDGAAVAGMAGVDEGTPKGGDKNREKEREEKNKPIEKRGRIEK